MMVLIGQNRKNDNTRINIRRSCNNTPQASSLAKKLKNSVCLGGLKSWRFIIIQ
jgi:hypothetical protein